MPHQTAFMPSMQFICGDNDALILIGLKYAMVKAKTNMPVPSDVINRSDRSNIPKTDFE